MNELDKMTAQTQIRLAFFYGAQLVIMFIVITIWWDKLSKVDVGILGMFVTNAMNQSKDAATFFFARHRTSSADDSASNGNGGGDPGAPLVPSPPAKTT